jgi:hypothetical protein
LANLPVLRTVGAVNPSCQFAGCHWSAGDKESAAGIQLNTTNAASIHGREGDLMPLFLYRCTNTGLRVQGFSADDVAVDAHTYESVICTACKQTHLVNPATGVVLGGDIEPSRTKR